MKKELLLQVGDELIRKQYGKYIPTTVKINRVTANYAFCESPWGHGELKFRRDYSPSSRIRESPETKGYTSASWWVYDNEVKAVHGHSILISSILEKVSDKNLKSISTPNLLLIQKILNHEHL